MIIGNKMLAKLLTGTLRQLVGPKSCRALAHTDGQIPDNSSPKKTLIQESKRKGNSEAGHQRGASSGQNLRHPELATAFFRQYPNYCQMVTEAKIKARRSILIDNCGAKYLDLRTGLKNIEHVYYIDTESRRGTSRLTLIEFKTECDAENVAKRARHNEGLLPVPLKVFLNFDSGETDQKALAQQEYDFPIEYVDLTLKTDLSASCSSYKQLLLDNTMSLVALKLRFITLVNFERILCSGLFEDFELIPFGSSVIDLGHNHGDLDIVITKKHFQQLENSQSQDNQNSHSVYQNSPPKLIHLDKSIYNEIRERSGTRGTMRYFDNILREFMPLTDGTGVQFIRHARVPIIKFTARITSIDCDLSLDLGPSFKNHDNLNIKSSGPHMAEMLYSLCRYNNLFPAIAVYLKLFGKLSGIITKELNVGLTNFQYLSIIISYLQHTTITSHRNGEFAIEHSSKSKRSTSSEIFSPLVPPFKKMFEATTNDGHKLEKNLPDIFYTDMEIEAILPMMIVDFFQFYSKFDFMRNALNIFEGRIEEKMDNSTIYVQNPMDSTHNICHNVNRRGLDQFIQQCRSTGNELKRATSFKCPLDLIKYLASRDFQNSKSPQVKKDRRLQSESARMASVRQPYRASQNLNIARDVCR